MIPYFPSQIIEYIDEKFPFAKEQCDTNGARKSGYLQHHFAPAVSQILTMVESMPPRVLTLREKALTEFGEALAAIRIAVNVWTNVDSQYELRNLYGETWHPISLIRKHILTLTDEGIDPQTQELLFISDKQLREELRRDITAVNESLDNGGWKAATVLACSVVEAVLLDFLDDKKHTNEFDQVLQKLKSCNDLSQACTPSNLASKWRFIDFIRMSSEFKLFNESTLKLCDIARDFRNFIHPGKIKRTAQTCDRGTALAAVAAMEHVIRDLS